MTYAGERTILDADSHVMELGDFLDDFIDPAQRDRCLLSLLDDGLVEAVGEETYALPA